MTTYNPQLRVSVNRILEDGSDLPFEVDFFGGADINHTITNKPIHVTCSINNSLAGSQNTATVTIANSQYLEKFRRDPQAEIAKLRGVKLRLRIWAWYDNNTDLQVSAVPFTQPVFVGDVLDGFGVQSKGISDSSIQLKAQGHSWLATSGKLKTTFSLGSTYLEVVQQLMTEIVDNRGQGQETNGDRPFFIIDDSIESLSGKMLPSTLTVNRNPMEVLNDICRDVDYLWGVHNNIPYIMPKSKASSLDHFLIGQNNLRLSNVARCSHLTGMQGIINYSADGYNFSHNYDRNLVIGRTVEVSDEPQTGQRGTFVAGRVDQVTTLLDNIAGHKMSVQCSYLTEYDPAQPFQASVVLPERRADNSGLRSN